MPNGAMAGGWWFRAEAYEIRDGLIRPAAGAKIDLYDPWAQHVPAPRRRRVSDARGLAGAEERPYQALLRLAHMLRDPVTGIVTETLSRRQEDALLEWCRENGLLGILPHQVETVMFPATPTSTADDDQLRGTPLAHGYRRTALGWELETREVGGRRATPGAPAKSNGGVHLRVRLPKRVEPNARSGGVIMRSLPEDRLEREDLGGTWSQFFSMQDRATATSWPFPSFADAAFWRLYGESVSWFVTAAGLLADAVDMIAQLREADSPTSRETLDAMHQQINALAAPAAPALRSSGSGSEMRWTTPSLLSSYAIMTAIDLAGGADVRRCGVCGSPFITATGWANYCSTTCRKTQNRRVNRKRERLSLELATKGWDVTRIAHEVGARDGETVQGWLDKARREGRLP